MAINILIISLIIYVYHLRIHIISSVKVIHSNASGFEFCFFWIITAFSIILIIILYPTLQMKCKKSTHWGLMTGNKFFTQEYI